MQLYEVLGLPPAAADDEIRAAITHQRRLWRRRATSPDLSMRHEAERRMALIDQAERTLLDGERRKAYADPESQSTESNSAEGRWIVRATEQMERGQHGAALFSAQRAVSDDPDNAYAYSVLAEAALATGDEWAATEAIEKALFFEPEDARLHAQRAEICSTTRDTTRAVAALQTAISLDASPEYHVALISLLAENGDIDAAITAGEKAYQAHPDDEEIRTLLASVLSDRAVEANHELADGKLLITSVEQADFVIALCERGLSVHPAPDVESDLQNSLRYARKAKRKRFSMAHFRRHWKWPVGTGFFALSGICCIPNVAGTDAALGGATMLIATSLVALCAIVTWFSSFETRYVLNAAILERVVPKRMGRLGTPGGK